MNTRVQAYTQIFSGEADGIEIPEEAPQTMHTQALKRAVDEMATHAWRDAAIHRQVKLETILFVS